jgi:glycosyltransferase involved in cell wall biosynthesis
MFGPLVTIIIPCFNGETFVDEAIRSALSQTYPNKEVIVIDDGSSDSSLKVIQSFGDQIRWETGPNRGGSAARNRGLHLSNGELIQFLDADDVLFPEKLARMVPVALAHGPKAMPICDWAIQRISGRMEYNGGISNYSGEDPLVFCLGRRLQTTSPLHWRVNLDRIEGFDENLPCCQEFDLHLRLAILGLTLISVPEILYVVRSRLDSVSADGLKVIKQHPVIFGKVFGLAQAAGDFDGERRQALAHAYAKDARHLVRFHDQPDLARDYYSLAESIKPGAALNAFGNFWTRSIAHIVGPIVTERLIARVRPVKWEQFQ